jgi:UDP-N-acetylglucosamine--N-acetylmuramyl-(pentapeptide) pyrophosphoryl-undecaprenol N-acetylglucosamine transferase
MKKHFKTIVLASGGTGGHMFPAKFLSDELIKRQYNLILLTDERGNRFTKSFDKNINIHIIHAKTFKKGLLSKIGTIINIIFGFFYALKILNKAKPKVIVCFGGYASFPSTLAASFLGIPIIIHEQNALIGKTNRFMLPFAKKLATSFEKVEKIAKIYKRKAVFTGLPVSKKIEKISKNKYPENDKINILITGGSQGAKIFGDVVPNALKILSPNERKKIKVTQQVIEEDISEVKNLYKKLKIEAEIASFFDDIDKKLSSANLFIGRSGASTVTELMIVGRASILVPLPIAMEDHQKLNATILANNGACWIINQDIFTPENLANRLKYFIKNKELLKVAGNNAKNKKVLNADKNLADLIETEIKK